MRLRVVTHNWPPRYGGNDYAHARYLARHGSVIGLQESLWTYKRSVRPLGWARHQPLTAYGRVAQPIWWNTAVWRRVRSGKALISLPTVIQREAAGPRRHRGRHLVWVLLEHRVTGHRVVFANVHLVPSKHLGGAALALYERQVAGVARWLDASPVAKSAPVVLMGDFNGQPDDPQLRPLRRRGKVISAPSHGRRAIDHVWLFGPTPLRGRALDANGQSDHLPVLGVARTGLK
jgi:endonuclease/exonuclease/phosphatase family metal-dependent hydrolase